MAVLGGLFQFVLFSCPSNSTHANRPSKLIYTAASCARLSGFPFSSSQHECRINNISPISRETQSASQERVASHSVMGVLWRAGEEWGAKREWSVPVTEFMCWGTEKYAEGICSAPNCTSFINILMGQKVADHYRSEAKCCVKLNNLTFPFWQ